MEHRILISGYGGQGIVSAGILLGEACSAKGLNVTYMPEYGPETRGGLAAAGVKISDQPIGSPVIDDPSILIAMDTKSMMKFEPTVVPGGILVWNTGIIEEAPKRTDVKVIGMDFNAIAESLNAKKAVNMPILAVLMTLTNDFEEADVKGALEKKFAEKKNVEQIVSSSMAVFEKGTEVFKELNK